MDLLDRFSGVIPCGEGWKALCPCHADVNPSLCIDRGAGGRWLLDCKAGCKTGAILQELGLEWGDLQGDGSPVPPRPSPSLVADAEAEVRDRAYRAYLGYEGFELSRVHLEDLVRRGLTEAQIEAHGYRSLDQHEAKFAARQAYAAVKENIYRVPGFSRSLNDGEPRVFAGEGLGIPVRDHCCRVVGICVRTGESGKKYTWFSSEEARSGSPTHVSVPLPRLPDMERGYQAESQFGSRGLVGEDDALHRQADSQSYWIVTEGSLKANVSSALWGRPVLGVAGVTAWKQALPTLKALGAQKVILAFDADWRNKAQIKEQIALFHGALEKAGHQVKYADWDPKDKGLDDALLAGQTPRIVERLAEMPTVAEKDAEEEDDRDIVVWGNEIKVLPVEWIWQDWLARGTITMLDGDPGLGKSTLACAVAAAVTSGRLLAGSVPRSRPGNVLYLSAEDDPARTLIPRLLAAEANINRIAFWKGIRKEKGGRDYTALPELPDDLERLGRLVRKHRADLVIIDPLMAYLSANLDAHKDQHVRMVLSGVNGLCEETQVCSLSTRHLNKNQGTSAIYRGSSSIAITAAARTVWLMAADPDPEHPCLRHLCQVKNNLSFPQKGLCLEICGEPPKAPWIEWVGDSMYTADELLTNHSSHKKPKEMGARIQWLLLALGGKGLPSKDLYDLARSQGWSSKQVWQAARSIGCRKKKNGKTHWILPPVDPRTFGGTGSGKQEQGEG